MIFAHCFANLDPQFYIKRGQDWSGICKSGTFQSPVNIIDDVNTIEDSSVVSFDYSVPKDGLHKQFFFNGKNIFVEIDLGTMAFINKRGANEIYRAYKIELHFPAEHYITLAGQTPRYPLEVQIFHHLIATDNGNITNKVLKVKRAVVSFLFTIGDVGEGDEFLNQLGISKYNVDMKMSPVKFKSGNHIKQINYLVANYDTGFNVKALQGLLNIINADHHIYMYYGSETTPPCREDVFWIVFARPRSISKYQFKFLRNQVTRRRKTLTKEQLLKKQLSKTGKNRAHIRKSRKHVTRKDLFGNNRMLQPYRDDIRGKILSNKQGVRQVLRQNFFGNAPDKK